MPLSQHTALTKYDWRSVAKTIVASRRIDEIEETELVPAGKVTYQFSAKGHELGQVLLAHRLTHAHDCATVYYRSRPFTLHAGMTYQEAFSGPLARAGSRNGGRDIGVVHNLTPRLTEGRNITVLPASGDVGAQYTPAAGWAQAITYRSNVMKEESWNGAIAVCLAGDASVATNGFWSALTMATTLSLPIVFYIEDNQFGISVRGHFQTPGGNIAENLASMKNLLILDGDGANPAEADSLIAKAVDYARTEGKPVLLHLSVPRICGHSGADSQAYKSKEERADEEKRDPIPALKKFLITKKILKESEWNDLLDEVEQEVRAGVQAALAEPEPDTATVNKYAFYDGSTVQTVGGAIAEGFQMPEGTSIAEDGARVNLIEAVKRTLDSELLANNRVMVFGEDVGIKGGVHGATMDLQIRHGDQRVFDTSLSEEGIIGRAIGLAYAGLVPVPEIQFRKYLDPAMEHINDCGTIRWRTNNQFAAPMILRIPVGYSKRTGDPWHSVSGEAIFAHTIGWKIAFPSNARDAAGLLRTALRGNDPVFFLEHRNLLDTASGRSLYPGDNYVLPFGKAVTIQEGTQATIVTWGDMVYRSKEAADAAGASVEIIDLRTITPWDKESVFTSVRKTNRCLVVHEDGITNGFGAEIAASIQQECFRHLDAPVVRHAMDDIPVPYNKILMNAVVPNSDSILRELQSLLQY
ncbi:MAG: dehydrogenase E1 component subunit alpha/beta [Candidatus Kapabacteria bacterium]|nr:dehydrogenase E1 component subunit alpha/beta [Candidatus Kapabacteria bacterium]